MTCASLRKTCTVLPPISRVLGIEVNDDDSRITPTMVVVDGTCKWTKLQIILKNRKIEGTIEMEGNTRTNLCLSRGSKGQCVQN